MIAVIDYGAGNLRSVMNAIAHLGYRAEITDQPGDLLKAKAVILPGVGAAGDAMGNLKKLGLVEPIGQVIAEDRPFLGICLGLQILLQDTAEGGGQDCLGVLPGRVRHLPAGLKIPQIGWNQVRQKLAHAIFEDIPDGANFYFVHSYYADPQDKSVVAAETEYGVSFCCVAARGNLVAVQFHPEKSGDLGLRIYENFFKLAGVKRSPAC
jgi:glutamine amidotransferase